MQANEKWKHNLLGNLEYCYDRRSQINNLIMHLSVLRLEEQFKPQSSKWQEMRTIREEIKKMVTKIAIHWIFQTKKSCFKEDIGKSHPFYRSVYYLLLCLMASVGIVVDLWGASLQTALQYAYQRWIFWWFLGLRMFWMPQWRVWLNSSHSVFLLPLSPW